MNAWGACAIVCAVLAALVPPAGAFEIYRYRMPDGAILYTDEVSTKGRLQEVIESPAPVTKQIEKERGAKLKREAARTDRVAAQRAASLDTVELEIRDATQTLVDAKAALAAGVEPRAGERLGINSGHTRLSPAYWARQRKLRQAVDEARERLDDAYSARNVLR